MSEDQDLLARIGQLAGEVFLFPLQSQNLRVLQVRSTSTRITRLRQCPLTTLNSLDHRLHRVLPLQPKYTNLFLIADQEDEQQSLF